jgi:hypothetical protein
MDEYQKLAGIRSSTNEFKDCTTRALACQYTALSCAIEEGTEPERVRQRPNKVANHIVGSTGASEMRQDNTGLRIELTDAIRMKALMEENAKLRLQLEQAQKDADRLRGGITEKKRYLKLNPANARNVEVDGDNYRHFILEIDNKIEHILVYQDLEDNLTLETKLQLQKALNQHFGKQILLLITGRPGMELGIFEIVR